jgi:hypothetical protein
MEANGKYGKSFEELFVSLEKLESDGEEISRAKLLKKFEHDLDVSKLTESVLTNILINIVSVSPLIILSEFIWLVKAYWKKLD